MSYIVRVRQHLGTLIESLKTTKEVSPTKNSLAVLINSSLGFEISSKQIEVKPYGYDERTEWDTYIIVIKGYGVYGFADGPLL